MIESESEQKTVEAIMDNIDLRLVEIATNLERIADCLEAICGKTTHGAGYIRVVDLNRE